MSDRDDLIKDLVTFGCGFSAIGAFLKISRERVRQIAGKLGIQAPAPRGRRLKSRIWDIVIKGEDAWAVSPSKQVSLKRLQELLYYRPDTGEWIWKSGRRAGYIANRRHRRGYVQIRIDGKLYMSHVLAWFYSFERWPSGEIDHINRIKSDNRLNNLRVVTHIQNLGNSGVRPNNTSGVKGIWKRPNGKWCAEIAHIKLGTFETKEAAAQAYETAAKVRFCS